LILQQQKLKRFCFNSSLLVKQSKLTRLKRRIAEARLRELLGDAGVGLIRGVERFKLQNSTNSKIDRKALEAGWPEAYEATLVKTPYDFIKAL
jgi:hypothetical protein